MNTDICDIEFTVDFYDREEEEEDFLQRFNEPISFTVADIDEINFFLNDIPDIRLKSGEFVEPRDLSFQALEDIELEIGIFYDGEYPLDVVKVTDPDIILEWFTRVAMLRTFS